MIPMELSFKNFFSDLIFHPEHARPEDQKKCLILSVALGIFSLGIIPLVVGIGWGVRKVVSWVTDKSPAEEKTSNVFQNTVVTNTVEKKDNIGTNAVEKKDNTETYAIERKGFQNPLGGHCFLASALHCLASVKEYLPKDFSQSDNKLAAEQTLELLDNVLSGVEGTDQELTELKKKLKLEGGGGDAGVAFNSLVTCLKMEEVKIFESNEWWSTAHPFRIIDEDFSRVFKTEDGISKAHLPLADKTKQKLNFFAWHRCHLPEKPVDRKAAEIPQFIQVPQVDLSNNDQYELVATAQSLGGHAVAYVKESEQWLKYDDEKVSKLSNDTAMKDIAKDSMILVYRRVL